MKIEICDDGRFNKWVNVDLQDGEDFQLFIDGQYIGAGTVDAHGNLIFVSTLHKVEFKKEGD